MEWNRKSFKDDTGSRLSPAGLTPSRRSPRRSSLSPYPAYLLAFLSFLPAGVVSRHSAPGSAVPDPAGTETQTPSYIRLSHSPGKNRDNIPSQSVRNPTRGEPGVFAQSVPFSPKGTENPFKDKREPTHPHSLLDNSHFLIISQTTLQTPTEQQREKDTQTDFL